MPEGTTSVSGSTLLGHFAGHDLDLVVLPAEVDHLVGDPSRARKELGCLRAEYERLKAAGMDGAQKAAFFDRVVAMLS